MAHRRTKLAVFGRQLLVELVELEGCTIAQAAKMSGASRQTATKWVRRHRAISCRAWGPRHCRTLRAVAPLEP